MAYTSLQDLEDRFGAQLILQLADRATPPAGAPDAAVIGQAIEDTDALIDGYLKGRYKLPLVNVPALVATLAGEIAIYKLHIYEPNPKIADDYKMAIKGLEAIAAGRIRLDVEGVEPETSGQSGARLTDRERPMTEAKMKGFI
ncbi:gp436 family protein [Pseudoroseicyclus sp. H15]